MEGIAEKYSDDDSPVEGDPWGASGDAASLDDLAGLGINVRSVS